VEQVFRALDEIELVFYYRTADIEARRSALHAIQVPTADAPFGQRIVQAVVPFIAAPARFGSHYSGSESSVLCQVGHHRDLHRLHAVDGNAESEAASRRVGHIDRVDEQRAVVLAEPCNLDRAILPANDPGYQRERVRQSGRTSRREFRLRGWKVLLDAAVIGHSICAIAFHINGLLAERHRVQDNFDVRRVLAGGRVNRSLGLEETFLGDVEEVGSGGGQTKACLASRVSYGYDALLVAQHYRNTGVGNRLVLFVDNRDLHCDRMVGGGDQARSQTTEHSNRAQPHQQLTQPQASIPRGGQA